MMRLIAALSLASIFHFVSIGQQSAAYLSAYEIATNLQRQGKNEAALDALKLAINEARSDSLLIAKCLNSMMSVSDRLGHWAEAVNYGRQAASVFRSQSRDTLLASVHYGLGITYFHIGDYEAASHYLLGCSGFFAKAGKPLQLSYAHNILGLIYSETAEYNKAVHNHLLALKIRTELNVPRLIAGSLNNLGATYKEMEYLDSAQYYLMSSLRVKKQLNDSSMLSSGFYNLAEVEMMVGNYDEAEHNLMEALQLLETTEDVRKQAYAIDLLGQIKTRNGSYSAARVYLDSALAMADRANIRDLMMENYLHQAKLAVRQQKLATADFYYNLYINLNGQLQSAFKVEAQKRLEIRYDVKRRIQENEQLRKENEIQRLQVEATDAKARLFRRSLIAAGVILGLALFISVLLYKQSSARKRLAQREQHHKREMHHRLKNNLQTLLGLCTVELSREGTASTIEAVKRLKNQVQAMTLIHNHLNMRSDEDAHVEMKPYLETLVKSIAMGHGFDPRTMTLNFDLENPPLDAEMAQTIGLIVNEAVTNSFKHGTRSGQPPSISLCLFSDTPLLWKLEIADDGPGIPPEMRLQELISVGLRLIQTLVRELDGTCELIPGAGAHWVIILPKKGAGQTNAPSEHAAS